MSIVKEIVSAVEQTATTTAATAKVKLTIDNGDLQALNQIIEKYRFKDEESALRFAFFALLTSENNIISVEENGKKVNLIPSEKLLRPKDNGSKG